MRHSTHISKNGCAYASFASSSSSPFFIEGGENDQIDWVQIFGKYLRNKIANTDIFILHK